MPSLVILGAGGFLGKALIASGRSSLRIKAVARSVPVDAALKGPRISWFAGDLLESDFLPAVLECGDLVCNLAYIIAGSEANNLQLIDNVIDACVQRQAARLVHCSTAIVAGAAPQAHIVESTPCVPVTPYERTKWNVERRVLQALGRGVDVGILRPTAIVGAGGENLRKLARQLQNDSAALNYVRASIFGKRPLHLVPVGNVAAALLHLAALQTALQGNIYHVCSDDDSGNNFLSVEKELLRALGLRPRKWPLLSIPAWVLKVLLALRGRSPSEVTRIYDGRKLLSTGFKPTDSVLDAVRQLGRQLRSDRDVSNGHA